MFLNFNDLYKVFQKKKNMANKVVFFLSADPCAEKPFVEGRCRARKPRFSWDGAACREFVYGGCGGTRNRFDTREECLLQCQRGSEFASRPILISLGAH